MAKTTRRGWVTVTPGRTGYDRTCNGCDETKRDAQPTYDAAKTDAQKHENTCKEVRW